MLSRVCACVRGRVRVLVLKARLPALRSDYVAHGGILCVVLYNIVSCSHMRFNDYKDEHARANKLVDKDARKVTKHSYVTLARTPSFNGTINVIERLPSKGAGAMVLKYRHFGGSLRGSSSSACW